MTTWNEQVAHALAHLEKPGRKFAPAEYLAIIDDVVLGELNAAAIAAKHGTRDMLITALAHVTTAAQGGGQVRPLSDGGWYEFRGDERPYAVAPGFAAAWKAARDL